ncbi:hypothetical protein AB0A69_01010 [Streptomyces sp. NPDC045431]|uniref:hypothetical protein n=1 Tax=Streptomyces sp. NPDC045431 TaxID=3155613 RepID=UPI00340E41E7
MKREAAARNNAEWCDAMCRAHGLPGGTFGDRAWTHPRRTPPYYPDAVTLAPGASDTEIRAMLDAVDRSTPGCSVKDSFAELDLTPHGFEVLFEGQWIHRPAALAAPGPVTRAWEPVETVAELAAWQTAWNGGDRMDLFRPALLADPATTVLAGRAGDGRIVAGAVVSRTAATATATADATAATTGVVGVSNLFGPDAWPGCLAAIADRWPGMPVVGYEHGDDLAAALRHGFKATGPLRVWLSSSAVPGPVPVSDPCPGISPELAHAADTSERDAADT